MQIGEPIDTFGGAGGEENARAFEVFGEIQSNAQLVMFIERCPKLAIGPTTLKLYLATLTFRLPHSHPIAIARIRARIRHGAIKRRIVLNARRGQQAYLGITGRCRRAITIYADLAINGHCFSITPIGFSGGDIIGLARLLSSNTWYCFIASIN